MGYPFLIAAISAEVVGTLCLRASDGFARPGFVAGVVIGYVASFILLSMSLQRGLPLGLAYGIWAAVGVTAVAGLSVPLFGETLSPLQIVGIALVAGGVLALEAGARH